MKTDIARPTGWRRIAAAGILAAGAGFAFVPVASGRASVLPQQVHAPIAARAYSRTICDTCGTVESIQHMPAAAGAPASWQFTLRMHDGSTRTSTAAGAGRWQAGDRMILIAGDAAIANSAGEPAISNSAGDAAISNP